MIRSRLPPIRVGALLGTLLAFVFCLVVWAFAAWLLFTQHSTLSLHDLAMITAVTAAIGGCTGFFVGALFALSFNYAQRGVWEDA
ncbi:MAG: hypothetical protein AAGA68_04350 [Pseudomonadota bacterium]